MVILLICASSCFAEDITAGSASADSGSLESLKDFDWPVTPPLNFLELLKNHARSAAVIKSGNKPPKDWVTNKDVKKLIGLVDSKTLAAPVVSEGCPFMPSGCSTVGNEAMFLIEGYRKGAYPPTLCSIYDFKGDPDEYKRWWDEYVYRKEGIRQTGGAATTQRNWPSPQEVLKDSKPRVLSPVDLVLLSQEEIYIGYSRIDILVSRITNAVEYVWAYAYNRYVRPKFVLPNVEKLRKR
ncbi:MAG: hypothetical protein NTY34_01435 [Candidatus Omnitrophica bacterium]|nr:hypothetical protein [Candidatus Omnitrophota bacterium]